MDVRTHTELRSRATMNNAEVGNDQEHGEARILLVGRYRQSKFTSCHLVKCRGYDDERIMKEYCKAFAYRCRCRWRTCSVGRCCVRLGLFRAIPWTSGGFFLMACVMHCMFRRGYFIYSSVSAIYRRPVCSSCKAAGLGISVSTDVGRLGESSVRCHARTACGSVLTQHSIPKACPCSAAAGFGKVDLLVVFCMLVWTEPEVQRYTFSAHSHEFHLATYCWDGPQRQTLHLCGVLAFFVFGNCVSSGSTRLTRHMEVPLNCGCRARGTCKALLTTLHLGCCCFVYPGCQRGHRLAPTQGCHV